MSEPVNVRDDRKHTFFIVDNALIEKHGRAIGPYGIAVYSALAMHANGARRCSPSVTSIANEIGACPRQVRAKMRQLAELGLLTIEAPPAKGAKSPTNTYVLKDVETTPACGATPAYSAALTPACDATVAPDAAPTPAPHATPARRAARPAPPTRVVSSPPSEETNDQDQPSGAKAPSGSSAAKPPKAPRAKAVRAARPLFDAFCRAWHLPADGGRNPGLAGGFDSRCSEQGATVAEFEAWVREQRQCGDWGKYTRPHSTTDLFLAARDTAAARRSSFPTAPGDGSEDLAKWGDILVAHAAMDKEPRR